MNTTRFQLAARGLRAPEISPDIVPPAGAGAELPPPSIGADLIARGKSRPKALPDEPEVVVAPAAEAAPDDVETVPAAEEPPAETAPEGETPEQELERLKAEKAALENPEGESDPVKAELAKLRAEVEALKAGKPVDENAVPAAVSDSAFRTVAELEKREKYLLDLVDFAEDHPDGFEGKDGSGNAVSHSAEELAKWARNARRELRTMPAERDKLRDMAAAAAANKAKFPTHFNAAHPDSRAVAAIFSEYPALRGNHRAAAEILAGRRAAKAPAARPPVKAPTPPAKSPTAPPVTGGRALPEPVDWKTVGRTGTGFGHTLIRRA